MAVGALVYKQTGDAAWTTLVAAAAAFLPIGLLGPIGGALTDRFGIDASDLGDVEARLDEVLDR